MLAMIPTNFADSSSGLGALGIDGQALIIQLVTFLLAFWVLQHWAFGPITRMMEQRRKTIAEGVHLGEKMQKEQAELEAKVARTIHEARGKADTMLAAAQTEARQTIQEAEDKAREKAEEIVDSAKVRIEQDKARARRQVEGEVVNLVAEATEAIIDEKIDAKRDAGLIDKALKGRNAA